VIVPLSGEKSGALENEGMGILEFMSGAELNDGACKSAYNNKIHDQSGLSSYLLKADIRTLLLSYGSIICNRKKEQKVMERGKVKCGFIIKS
jgi:hypothetical protein